MSNDAADNATPEDLERQALADLVTRHEGNLSAIARALSLAARELDPAAPPVTRQVVTRKLMRFNLTKAAETARARGLVSGPRPGLKGGVADPRGERQAIESALGRCNGYRAAAAELKLSPRTMIRKMKIHGIDMAAVKAARAERLGAAAEKQKEQIAAKRALKRQRAQEKAARTRERTRAAAIAQRARTRAAAKLAAKRAREKEAAKAKRARDAKARRRRPHAPSLLTP